MPAVLGCSYSLLVAPPQRNGLRGGRVSILGDSRASKHALNTLKAELLCNSSAYEEACACPAFLKQFCYALSTDYLRSVHDLQGTDLPHWHRKSSADCDGGPPQHLTEFLLDVQPIIVRPESPALVSTLLV